MKLWKTAIAVLSLVAPTVLHAEQKTGLGDLATVSPALDMYSRDRLLGEVWKRSDLSGRDRSIVTLAALVARNQTIDMA